MLTNILGKELLDEFGIGSELSGLMPDHRHHIIIVLKCVDDNVFFRC